MARMTIWDKLKDVSILHSVDDETVTELLEDAQKTMDEHFAKDAKFRETYIRKTGRNEPVRLSEFRGIVDAFNKDMEALFKTPSRAYAIIDDGVRLGACPPEVAATLMTLIDLGAIPLDSVGMGEPENLDDLL